jgi:hypothetical protein
VSKRSTKVCLQRVAPWVIAGVAVTAILLRYPPSRIGREMIEGDLLAASPFAALMIFVGIFGICGSDWLIINGAAREPERRVPYFDAVRARAGMSLLGMLGYGAGVGGLAVWIARVTRVGARLAGGIALYLMSADLVAVCIVASAAYWIGRPDIGRALGIVAPAIAGALLLLKMIGPASLLVPAEQLPRVFLPWSRIARRQALGAVALRTLNIGWITTMVWLGANAFGLAVPFAAMATYFPIILVVGSMPVNVAGFGAVQGAWLMLAPWAKSAEQVIAFSVLWQLVVGVAVALRGLPFLRGVVSDVAQVENLEEAPPNE